MPPSEYTYMLAWGAWGKSKWALDEGRLSDAKTYAEECLRHFQKLQNPEGKQVAWVCLARANLALGEYPAARESLLEVRRLSESVLGTWRFNYEGTTTLLLATGELAQGNLAAALEFCQESIRQADMIPDRNMIAHNLGLLAGIAAKGDQAVRAARLAGASVAMWARQQRPPAEDISLDTLLPGWRASPVQLAISASFEAGLAMPNDEAVAYALGDELG
jgi:hypothetical protein